MSRSLDAARRTAALLLALLLVAPSAVVPVLDRGELHTLPVFQSAGADACCVPAHNHWICTQYGANPLAAAAAGPVVEPVPVERTAGLNASTVAHAALHHSSNHSRAPPHA